MRGRASGGVSVWVVGVVAGAIGCGSTADLAEMGLADESTIEAEPLTATDLGGVIVGPVAIGALYNDLAITALGVDADCHFKATFRNRGTLALTDEQLEHVTVQFTRDGGGIGGWSLGSATPLKTPGGEWSMTLSPYKVDGTSTYEAQLYTASISDTYADDDYMLATMSCRPKLPDLVLLSVVTNPDCTKTLTVANQGDGEVLDSAYINSPARITRVIDGIGMKGLQLNVLDPGKALKSPGGVVTYTESADYRAYSSFTYTIEYPWQEKSAANNALSGSASPVCAGTRPAFELEITNISLNSECRAVVTVRNNGPGAAPPALATTAFYKSGTSIGGWSVDVQPLTSANSVTTGLGPSIKDTTSVSVRVVLDGSYKLSDPSTDYKRDKTVWLRCPN